MMPVDDAWLSTMLAVDDAGCRPLTGRWLSMMPLTALILAVLMTVVLCWLSMTEGRWLRVDDAESMMLRAMMPMMLRVDDASMIRVPAHLRAMMPMMLRVDDAEGR